MASGAFSCFTELDLLGFAESAQIADKLLNDGHLVARRRGFAFDRLDNSPVLDAQGLDRRDNSFGIETHDQHLAISKFRREKSGGFLAFTDVIPRFFVEHCDAGRRAEDFGDLVLGDFAGNDVGQFVGVRQIAMGCDSWAARRHDERGAQGQSTNSNPDSSRIRHGFATVFF